MSLSFVKFCPSTVKAGSQLPSPTTSRYTSRASHVAVCACSVCVQLWVVWHVLFSYYSCLNTVRSEKTPPLGTADVWPVVSCIFNCRIFYPALSCSQPFWVRAHRSHGMSPAKMAGDKQSEGSSVQTEFKCDVSILVWYWASLGIVLYADSFEWFWPILMLWKHYTYRINCA